MIRPSDLHAEHYARDTIGIGSSQPRLSWRLEGNEVNWRQRGFALEICWSTGETESKEVSSAQSRLVTWPWRGLRSCEQCQVRVRVAGAGSLEWSQWSTWTTIESGLLYLENWQCSLIEADRKTTPRRPVVFVKDFRCTSPVQSARLYATSHGIYDARINDLGVSDQVLSPGWTSYSHRLLYQTHNVTELVRTGQNRLQVTVADGWYRGRLGFNGGRENIYGEAIGFIAKLMLWYTDGRCESFSSDETWHWCYGPYLSASLYDGEVYDASLPTCNAEDQHPVRCYPLPGTICAPEAPPVRRIEEKDVQSMIKSPSGKTILDFGQNFAGWVRVKIHASQSCKLAILHAEVLENGELGTRPLRQARAVDMLMVPPGKSILWEPKFTFHGFRFVQIDGWPGTVPTNAVTGIVVHTDMQRTGNFACSNAMLNRLHQNIVWSMRSNFLSIPTDCPQRDERLGWAGDINVFADTANYLYDTSGLLKSWLKDVAAEQSDAHGIVPLTIPNVMPELAQEPHAIWGDVTIMLPWALYSAFGDSHILLDQYQSMKAWLQAVTRRFDGLWNYTSNWKLGDWLDPDAHPDDPGDSKTDPVLVSDAFLVHVVQLMDKICRSIGRDSEAAVWRAEHARLRQTFLNEYVTPSGRLASDTQTAYTLALHFSLYSDSSQIRKASERLDYLVRRRSRFCIATGFAGTPFLGHAMTKCGLSNVFYRMLLHQKCPSWLYPVTMGATTMWERWDSMLPSREVNPGEMTSFNHYALGSVGSWMHRTIVGLRPLEPGWSKFAVEPIPGGGLRWAEGSYLSGYGLCRVRWEIRPRITESPSDSPSNLFWIRVEIPPNAVAALTLRGASSCETLGSGTYEREVVYAPSEWPPRVIPVRHYNTDDDDFEP